MIHLAVADISIAVIPKIKALFPSTPLVGTVHLPPANWSRQPKEVWAALGALDALVVLSNEQKRFFVRELPTANPVFIPHGVNCRYFVPRPIKSDEQTKPVRVIFVGTHLRDLNALAHSVSVVLKGHPSICFDLVLPSDLRPSTLVDLNRRAPNRVIFHDRVSSSSLLKLYQGADLALLPLKDATANNSILEAFACGLPVITTDVGGTRDYVSDESALLVPFGNTSMYSELLMSLVADRKRLRRMGIAARERAEELSWERIARQMALAYAGLYRGPAGDVSHIK